MVDKKTPAASKKRATKHRAVKKAAARNAKKKITRAKKKAAKKKVSTKTQKFTDLASAPNDIYYATLVNGDSPYLCEKDDSGWYFVDEHGEKKQTSPLEIKHVVPKNRSKPKGRPPVYLSEYDAIAHKMCMLGYTDAELADLFEVTEKTINEWKNRHPSFRDALKKGKSLADGEVVFSLYESATVYHNVTAQIFWLKNRRNENWRDKQEFQHDTSDALKDLMKQIAESNAVGPEHLRQ